MILETNSPQETFSAGRQLGEKAFPGQVITDREISESEKLVFTQGLAKRTWHRRTGKQSDLYDRAGV